MSTKKRTKYDKLMAVGQRISENFSKIDHPGMQNLGKLYGDASKIDFEEIKKKDPSVTRSQVAAGMEQGIRDLSMMLPAQDPSIRSAAMTAFRDALEAEYPEFLERDKERLAKILGRGYLKSENEWYLIQHRLDLIEGDPGHQEETEKIWEMMDNYAG